MKYAVLAAMTTSLAFSSARTEADGAVEPYVCGQTLELEYTPNPERLHDLLSQELPSWSLFLTGRSWATHPRDLDRASQMVAIREGDEDNPDRWVFFSLTNAWLEGSNFYFDDLIEEGKLTMLDLVAISFALAQTGEQELPLLPYSIVKDNTGPDVWGAFRPAEPYLHVAPPPPRKSGSSPALPGNHGPIPNPHPTTPLPTWAPPPVPIPTSNGDPRRDHENGVDPSDPTAPRRFYDDKPPATFAAANREVFRCEGEVYYGFRDRCIDFAEVSTQKRWSKKTDDALHSYFSHHLFNDGREPYCSEMCGYLGIIGATSATAGIWLTCIAATTGSGGIAGALCYAAPGGLAGGLLSTLSGRGAGTWLTNRCVRNYCRR